MVFRLIPECIKIPADYYIHRDSHLPYVLFAFLFQGERISPPEPLLRCSYLGNMGVHSLIPVQEAFHVDDITDF